MQSLLAADPDRLLYRVGDAADACLKEAACAWVQGEGAALRARGLEPVADASSLRYGRWRVPLADAGMEAYLHLQLVDTDASGRTTPVRLVWQVAVYCWGLGTTPMSQADLATSMTPQRVCIEDAAEALLSSDAKRVVEWLGRALSRLGVAPALSPPEGSTRVR